MREGSQNLWQRRLVGGAAALLVIAGLACGGGDGPTKTAPPEVRQIAFALTADTLEVGDSRTYPARVTSSAGGALGGEVIYRAIPEGVVQLGPGGTVTGLANGEVLLEAREPTGTAPVARLPLTVRPLPAGRLSVPPMTTLLGVGDTVRLAADVYDTRGVRRPGRVVTWRSTAPQVATVDTTGRVVGMEVGSTDLEARADDAVATQTVRVRALEVQLFPTAVVVGIGSHGQLWALLRDEAGERLPATMVAWRSMAPDVATVDSEGVFTAQRRGVAAVEVTLNGRRARTEIRVTEGEYPVLFPITLVPQARVSEDVLRAAQRAVARWQQVIAQTVGQWTPTRQDSAQAGRCFSTAQPFSGNWQGLTVYLVEGHLPSPTVGRGGPCTNRPSVTGELFQGLPIEGVVELDSAFVAGTRQSLGGERLREDLLMHELGHVLGIGTLWPGFDGFRHLAGDASAPVFTGAQAAAASAALGFPPGLVPVQGGAVSDGGRGHWRTSVYGAEIMTHVLSQSGGVLSAITIASLADLGFIVRPDAAMVTSAAALAPHMYGPISPVARFDTFWGGALVAGRPLGDDLWRPPSVRTKAARPPHRSR